MPKDNERIGQDQEKILADKRIKSVLGPSFSEGQVIKRLNSKNELVEDIVIVDAFEKSNWVTVKKGNSIWEYPADDLLKWNLEEASEEDASVVATAEEVSKEGREGVVQDLGLKEGDPVHIYDNDTEEVGWRFRRTWKSPQGVEYVEVFIEGGRAVGGIETKNIPIEIFSEWNRKRIEEGVSEGGEEVQRSQENDLETEIYDKYLLQKGDYVQQADWTGVQFTGAKRIIGFDRTGNQIYVLVEGESTGFPIEDIESASKPDITEELESLDANLNSQQSEKIEDIDLIGLTEEEVKAKEEEIAEGRFKKGLSSFRDKSSAFFGGVVSRVRNIFGNEKQTENPEIRTFIDDANVELVNIQETRSPKEKVGILRGLVEMGLAVRQYKNEAMSYVLGKAVSEKGNEKDWAAGENAGRVSRFFQKYSDKYNERGKQAQKNREDLYKPGGWLRQSARYGSGVGSLLGNGLLITRLVRGFGYNPFRTIGAIALQIGTAGEVLKGVNLDRLSKDTRIEDVEEAMAAAQAIYDEAKRRSSDGQTVSKTDLEKAYVKDLPEEILSKLTKDPEKFKFGSISQWLVKKEIKKSLSWLDKDLNNIESLNAPQEEKERMKDATRLKYGKYLKDMELMVAEGGAVDLWAYSSKIMEELGKKASAIMILETIAEGFLKVDKIAWDAFKKKFLDSPDEALIRSQKIVEAAGGSAAIASHIEKAAEAANRIDEKVFENFQVMGVGDGLKLEDVFANALSSEGYVIHADTDQAKEVSHSIVSLLKGVDPEKIKALGISSGDVEKISLGDKVDVNALLRVAFGEEVNEKERLAEMLESTKVEATNLHTTLEQVIPGDSSSEGESLLNKENTLQGNEAAKDEKWEVVFDKSTLDKTKSVAGAASKISTDVSTGETLGAESLDKTNYAHISETTHPEGASLDTTPALGEDSQGDLIHKNFKGAFDKEMSAEDYDKSKYEHLAAKEIGRSLDKELDKSATENLDRQHFQGLSEEKGSTAKVAEHFDENKVPIKKVGDGVTAGVTKAAETSASVEVSLPVSDVDRKLGEDIKDIFKTEVFHRKGFAEEDWLETKNDEAKTFLGQMESYRTSSRGRIIESLAIKRHLRLEEYMQKLADETKTEPKDGESIEEYIKRALDQKLQTPGVKDTAVSNMVDMVEEDKKMYSQPFKIPAKENVFEESSSVEKAVDIPHDHSTHTEVEKHLDNIPGADDSKFEKMAEAEVGDDVKKIYHIRWFDRWGAADWKDAKNQNAKAFIGVVERFVPGKDHSMNMSMINHKKLVDHMNRLMAETGLSPKEDESTEEFLKRLTAGEIKKINGIPVSSATIEEAAAVPPQHSAEEVLKSTAPEKPAAPWSEKDVIETPQGRVEIGREDEIRWLEEAKRQILESSGSKKADNLAIPLEQPGEKIVSKAIEEADKMGLSEELDLMSKGAVIEELDTIYGKKNIFGSLSRDSGIKSEYWKHVKDTSMERFQKFYEMYGKDKAALTPFKREENEKQFKLYQLLKRMYEQTGVKVKPEETVSEYMHRATKELLAKIHHSDRSITP